MTNFAQNDERYDESWSKSLFTKRNHIMSAQEDAYSFCPYLNLHKPHFSTPLWNDIASSHRLKWHFMYYVIPINYLTMYGIKLIFMIFHYFRTKACYELPIATKAYQCNGFCLTSLKERAPPRIYIYIYIYIWNIWKKAWGWVKIGLNSKEGFWRGLDVWKFTCAYG